MTSVQQKDWLYFESQRLNQRTACWLTRRVFSSFADPEVEKCLQAANEEYKKLGVEFIKISLPDVSIVSQLTTRLRPVKLLLILPGLTAIFMATEVLRAMILKACIAHHAQKRLARRSSDVLWWALMHWVAATVTTITPRHKIYVIWYVMILMRPGKLLT